jgi:hypothetical protein
VHAAVPYANVQHVLKGPFQIWNFYPYAENDAFAQGTHQFVMSMLIAQHVLKGLRSVHTLAPT